MSRFYLTRRERLTRFVRSALIIGASGVLLVAALWLL